MTAPSLQPRVGVQLSARPDLKTGRSGRGDVLRSLVAHLRDSTTVPFAIQLDDPDAWLTVAWCDPVVRRSFWVPLGPPAQLAGERLLEAVERHTVSVALWDAPETHLAPVLDQAAAQLCQAVAPILHRVPNSVGSDDQALRTSLLVDAPPRLARVLSTRPERVLAALSDWATAACGAIRGILWGLRVHPDPASVEAACALLEAHPWRHSSGWTRRQKRWSRALRETVSLLPDSPSRRTMRRRMRSLPDAARVRSLGGPAPRADLLGELVRLRPTRDGQRWSVSQNREVGALVAWALRSHL